MLVYFENLCKSFNKNKAKDSQRVRKERKHKKIIMVHPAIRG